MPELPEVESLRRVLTRSTVGKTIVSASVTEARLRRKIPPDFQAAVAGRKVESVSRRAKYLIVKLSGGHSLLAHLGMSGTLTHRMPMNCGTRADRSIYRDEGAPLDAVHDHVEFELDDGSRLVFNDPRRFGLLKLAPTRELDASTELRTLGPEPLGREFSANYLWQKARGRRVAIKNLLMDQRIVAGIGNIYAVEILFRAGIRPTRRAGRLTRAEVQRLVAATPEVLREAIGKRGTTFRSYRDSRGRPGTFGARLRVYGREGDPCYTCSTPIRNVIIGRRASCFCPRCQK